MDLSALKEPRTTEISYSNIRTGILGIG